MKQKGLDWMGGCRAKEKKDACLRGVYCLLPKRLPIDCTRIVHLRVDPAVAFKRMQKRNNKGEVQNYAL